MDNTRSKTLAVAVVGATGAVGEEMLKVLEERRLPVHRLVPLASERSAGRSVNFHGEEIDVVAINDAAFDEVDVALFSAGADISEEYAPIAASKGAFVIDNSRAFRMDPDVPLVIPEVNQSALKSTSKIIANPNCSTIQMVMALKPLHEAAKLKRVVVSTYQSASGAGRDAMNELRDQTIALLNFGDPKVEHFSRRLAFDALPHIDRFEGDGFTREEQKMINETRKILDLPDLSVCATCVRVPIFVGHAMSVNAEFEQALSLEAAQAALDKFPGIDFRRAADDYPVAADAAGHDDVFVGRLRKDPSTDNGFAFWVVADNLRKGAATNAVQIAETLLDSGHFG